jgi:predicted nuclease with TOPRIM domain
MGDDANKQGQRAPFGARIDEGYEKMFNELLPEDAPRGAKKELLERMISAYVRNFKKEEKDQLTMNFDSEVSLIASNLSNALESFRNIRNIAQDTIIANKNIADQKINNIQAEQRASLQTIEELNSKIETLEIRNKELAESNGAFNQVKTSLENEVKSLSDKVADMEKALNVAEVENATLIRESQEYSRLKLEHERHINKLQELERELKRARDTIEDKEEENKRFKNRITALEKDIADNEETKRTEIERIKALQNEKFEIDKEKAILEWQKRYNDLQIEFIDSKQKQQAEK